MIYNNYNFKQSEHLSNLQTKRGPTITRYSLLQVTTETDPKTLKFIASANKIQFCPLQSDLRSVDGDRGGDKEDRSRKQERRGVGRYNLNP